MATQVRHETKRRSGLSRAIKTLEDYIAKPDDVPVVDAQRAVAYLRGADFVKVGEAQKVLGVKSPTTIKKWIALGRFPGAGQTPTGQWLLPVARVYELRDASMRAKTLNEKAAPIVLQTYEGDPYEDFDL